MKMKFGKSNIVFIGFAILTIVIVGVYISGKVNNAKNKIAANYLAEIQTIVQSIPEYQSDPQYYDSLVERAFENAFEESVLDETASYSRWSGGELKVTVHFAKYSGLMLQAMTAQASQDGREEVVQAISNHWEEKGYPTLDTITSD